MGKPVPSGPQICIQIFKYEPIRRSIDPCIQIKNMGRFRVPWISASLTFRFEFGHFLTLWNLRFFFQNLVKKKQFQQFRYEKTVVTETEKQFRL